MNVKSAFLNGDLEEEIYMTLPEGVEPPPNIPNPVCRLFRALYGLKQASRVWNKKLDEFLISQGFRRMNSDHAIYIYIRKSKSLTMIVIHVDDLLIAANMEILLWIKRILSEKFAMTDCGEVKNFLGIRILRNREKSLITLDQEHFIDTILSRFGMTECKPVRTPLDTSVQLKKSNSEMKKGDTYYRQIIGNLMYVMIATRPDIAAAISITSQFLENPSEEHYTAAKRILRYLKGTKGY